MVTKTPRPSEREAVVLAILSGSEHFGRAIRDEYEERTGAKMPLGSLYTTLARMEDKGFLKSRQGESEHARGGNRRTYFRITASGKRALEAVASAILVPAHA